MSLATSRQANNNYSQQHQQHQYRQQSNGENNNSRDSRKKKDRPKPIGSALLTDAENEQLFQILGRDRVSLSAGVVQLLAAYTDNPNIWRKVNVGVVVLIKDYENRNYALALYDIFKQQLLWNQILLVQSKLGYFYKSQNLQQIQRF